ncbi:MAG: NDP-hexose 2,3-dehydratase family protein [Actinomycetota bacterium]|nr:NDP-hexose 2,3-dehydratase family protein [Actinomycetota bacterium]
MTIAAAQLPLPLLIAGSADPSARSVTSLPAYLRDLDDRNRRLGIDTSLARLDELASWRQEPSTGDFRHETGLFFSVTGLRVSAPKGVRQWRQPILNQPEAGILGVLVKQIDGVLHCLMQAKVEPGNRGGFQIAPTVQATWSNYSRAHNGRAVPFLEYFTDPLPGSVIADGLQSEQGAWFYRKRNHNVIVEVTGDVPAADGFSWLTIGQLHRLLAVDDLVSMDARSVLASLPFTGPDTTWPARPPAGGFAAALAASFSPAAGSLHPDAGLAAWLSENQASCTGDSELIPLREVGDWELRDGVISHASGQFFDIIGVRVRARNREVNQWQQPMLRACGTGVVAFLTARLGGVLHVLTRARWEPGYDNAVQIAPTVQRLMPAAGTDPPLFMRQVLSARHDQVRFDTVLPEEGGRFFHTSNRYLIVESEPLAEPPGFRWLTVHQLSTLVQTTGQVNVQARSLLACLHSLTSTPGGRG